MVSLEVRLQASIMAIVFSYLMEEDVMTISLMQASMATIGCVHAKIGVPTVHTICGSIRAIGVRPAMTAVVEWQCAPYGNNKTKHKACLLHL